MKKYMAILSKSITSLAMIVTVLSVNSTCMFYVHQDEVPTNAKKLRKF